MNCISGSIVLICPLALFACGVPASESSEVSASSDYAVHYTISPELDDESISIEMSVEQSSSKLIELAFRFSKDHVDSFAADGTVEVGGDTVVWKPAASGGKLSWRVRPSYRRNANSFDALQTSDWAIFRAEDIIPRARTRTTKGATSKTTMSFVLPKGWSAVSEYSTIESRIEVNKPERRFDQPSGWIAMGKLGIRRDAIVGTQVVIAAPRGEKVRRLDMLALLNWTLPELAEVLDDVPPRLTIISAGDPMWRGGLSAPASMFIHATRPLISENGTSTLLHEVVHIAFNMKPADGFDWIVEGLAEYYSIELLRRGSAITARRYQQAIAKQLDWAGEATELCRERSTGPTTAFAVIVFQRLNEEIKQKSDGAADLDKLVRELIRRQENVTLQSLQAAAATILGGSSDALNVSELPGCGG
jgi:hypothetical protein